MAEEPSRQKDFERLIGHELEDFPSEVLLRETLAYTHGHEADAMSREIGTSGPSTRACTRVLVDDVAGLAATDPTGTVKFLLKDYVCVEGGATTIDFRYPIVFVATVIGNQPVILTSRQNLAGEGDVEIEVFTWDANGARKGSVPFGWRCMVTNLSHIH